MNRRPPRARFVELATVAAVMVTVAWYMVATEVPASDDLSVPSFLTGVALVAVIPGLVAEWRRPRDPDLQSPSCSRTGVFDENPPSLRRPPRHPDPQNEPSFQGRPDAHRVGKGRR